MPQTTEYSADGVRYEIGDLVYAAEDILNDGGIPGLDPDGLIAPAGARGVIVDSGVAELDESQTIYLVQFEIGDDRLLGEPVGCLPDELTQQPSASPRVVA